MKILVTGFDPFGEEKTNPASLVVERLPCKISKAIIIPLIIPTVFEKSAEVVEKAIEKYQVDIVINIGQAGGRYGISPERVAINLDDASIPDNAGNLPIDHIIQENGENAYFTQLPIKAMVEALKMAGYPAYVSNSAGTYVCNHIMYQVQYLIATKYPQLKGGFIHIPYALNQVVAKPNQPSMSIDDMTNAIIVALETIILFEDEPDIHTLEGSIH